MKFKKCFILFCLCMLLFSMISPTVFAYENPILVTETIDVTKYGFKNVSYPRYTQELLCGKLHLPLIIPKQNYGCDCFTDKIDYRLHVEKGNTDRLSNLGYSIIDENSKYLLVDYHADLKASDKPLSIDLIPKIDNKELTQFAWWNSGWNYKKEITITNKIRNFQTKISIGYDDIGYDTHLNGNCLLNFSDIRFTNGSETGLIPYWIERNINGEYIDVWVNNTYNESTIYLYYGNPTIKTSESNPFDTFYFYDDFDNGNVLTGGKYNYKEVGTDNGDTFYETNGVIGMTDSDTDTSTITAWSGLEVIDMNPPQTDFEVIINNLTFDSGGSKAPQGAYYPLFGTTNDSGGYDLGLGFTDNWNSERGSLIAWEDDTCYNKGANYYSHSDTVNYTIRKEGTTAYYIEETTTQYTKTQTNILNYMLIHYGGHVNANYDTLEIDRIWIRSYKSSGQPSFVFGKEIFGGCNCIMSNFTPVNGSTGINYNNVNLSVDVNSSCGLLDWVNISLYNEFDVYVNSTNVSVGLTNGTFTHVLYNDNLSDNTLYHWYVTCSCNGSINQSDTFVFTTYISSGGCDCDTVRQIVRQELNRYNAIKGSDNIGIETTQFVILIELILFTVFMWIGYSIPAMEGDRKTFHYMPYSGGLFMLFGGIDFLAFSITIRTYNLPYVQEFFSFIGIIVMVYGILKAFYYE